ncbi:MAG: hydrogenase maturation protease [Rhodospirillales bacterium]
MVLPALAHMTALSLAVIGCGNRNRSDDGVGPRVIERLRAADLPSDVGLFDAGTDGMAVMYRARGVARLILVDARSPEGTPGAVYEVPGAVLQAPPPHSLNLHDFRWDHALYAGRKLYGEAFPSDVQVFLIEAESLDLGVDLSPAVEAASESVATRIAALAAA